MKKILVSIIIMLFLMFLTFEILTESGTILKSVMFSFTIWRDNIFPSLFPLFVFFPILVVNFPHFIVKMQFFKHFVQSLNL